MTIRLRLMLYYTGLLILILFLFGVVVFAMLDWTMRSQVDNTLSGVLDDILDDTTSAMETGPNGEPLVTAYVPRLDTFRTPGVYVQIWRAGDTPTLFSTSDNLAAYQQPLDADAIGMDHETRSEVEINGTNLRVATHPIWIEGQMVGNIQAAASLTTIEAASDRLLRIMLVGGIIAILSSLLIGDWLARRALRPVESIVSTAQSITAADDLRQRIAYDGPQDELGRMVTAFNETLTRLERLFLAQRRFVGDVSHELRTPLTTMQGNLDLVRLYGSDPKSIAAIEDEVKRMSRLIEDLLLLAQADSGQIPVHAQDIELDRLLLEVYDEAIFISEKRHTMRLGRFEQVMIEANPDRLKQLFINLITNAIKYTGDGGTITLSVWKKGEAALVSVHDTGIGIPKEDLPHLFDRFYRVDSARSRVAGGTGLGLSIVKWITEVHHGKITVDSVVGEGTTFTVSLPVKQPVITQDAEEKLMDENRSHFMPAKVSS